MYFDLDIKGEAKDKLEEVIAKQVIEYINQGGEPILELIKEVLRGQVKTTINNILQQTEIRAIIRDRVMKQLNIEEINNSNE